MKSKPAALRRRGPWQNRRGSVGAHRCAERDLNPQPDLSLGDCSIQLSYRRSAPGPRAAAGVKPRFSLKGWGGACYI